MPDNKRLLPRHRRRLKISLQGCGPVFSSDLSAGGFCVEVMRPPKRGTVVQGTLELDGRAFAFTGEVRWAEEGDLRVLKRGKMGVRFTGIANEFYQVFLSNTRGEVPINTRITS